jgi:hypothetical protein
VTVFTADIQALANMSSTKPSGKTDIIVSPELDRRVFRDLRYRDRLNGLIAHAVIQVTSEPPAAPTYTPAK